MTVARSWLWTDGASVCQSTITDTVTGVDDAARVRSTISASRRCATSKSRTPGTSSTSSRRVANVDDPDMIGAHDSSATYEEQRAPVAAPT